MVDTLDWIVYNIGIERQKRNRPTVDWILEEPTVNQQFGFWNRHGPSVYRGGAIMDWILSLTISRNRILSIGQWLVRVACSCREFAVYLRDWGLVLDAPLNCLRAVKTVVAGWIPSVATTVFSRSNQGFVSGFGSRFWHDFSDGI